MRLLCVLCFCCLWLSSQAQNMENPRKGFYFGAATGIGFLSLRPPNGSTQHESGLSLPNLKFGYLLNPRLGIGLTLPGSLYTYTGEGRKRSRGFEGMVPSVQFWLKNRWWLSSGIGVGLDAPAFYDIQNPDERKFYFGTAAIFGTGYEVFRKNNFSIDLQARLHLGSIDLPTGNQKGNSLNFLIGINWY